MQVWYAVGIAALVVVGCGANAKGPLDAVISQSGSVVIKDGYEEIGTLYTRLFESGWRGAGLSRAADSEQAAHDLRPGKIRGPSGTIVDCELRPEVRGEEVVLRYRLTPREDIELNSLHVSLDIPEGIARSGGYEVDGQGGQFPDELEDVHLYSGPTEELLLRLLEGMDLRLKFEEEVPVLIQDNRQWGPSFAVRIGPQMTPARTWPAGEAFAFTMTLSSNRGIDTEFDEPVTMAAGEDWVPLDVELDIIEGSRWTSRGSGNWIRPRESMAG